MPRPEVEDPHLPGRRHHHVGRLEVEVEDPLAMSVGEALAELPPDVEHALDGPRRAPAADLPEADALDELRRHPRPALVQAGGQHRRDVRVTERTRGHGVAEKAGDRRGGPLRSRRVELEGGRARRGVLDLEDDPARPAAHLAANLESAEGGRGLHGSPGLVDSRRLVPRSGPPGLR